MDEHRKPRAREKHVVNEGTGVEKKGEGLGTGPVNNTGSYEDRRRQEQARAEQPGRVFQQRPQQGNTGPFGGMNQRPQQGNTNPFGGMGQQRPQQGADPFSLFGQQRPGQGESRQRPSQGSQQRPPQGNVADGGKRKQYNSAVRQNGTGTQRASGSPSGGGSKLLLIVVALVLIFGGGRLFGLFGGGNPVETGTSQQTASGGNGQGGSLSDLFSEFVGTGGQSSLNLTGDLFGGSSGSGSQGGSILGSGGLTNLLSSFIGSSNSSVYDFTGGLSGNQGGTSSASQYFTSSSDSNSTGLDETVSRKARDKFTTIRGSKKDTVTIMVYMCGTDLESRQGMGTADLKEMVNAKLGDKVNLIVFTGGCTRWRNNVVSSRNNQIYQIRDGALYCLKENAGTGSMTSPETLTGFITYCRENFPANRMCLIFWDHGGGSVSGFGYDERYGRGQSMTLSGINTALKNAGVKFDFIGFDACLMATVENGIMLSQYADYMIASEETEPGVGWYYTNWLTRLSGNTSMPTIQIGKLIADDFVDVCNQKCRGQATTLSVVDLAELQATVPDELKRFSIGTNDLIQNKEYKTVSSARSKTREFAQQSRIDQIDLVHFARNMGTPEGKSLAKSIQGAVKYNRTGGGISNAYGLSIYFPYKNAGKVSQMVSTYKAIGMDEEYTRCIQEFASLEVSGQVSAGTSLANYGTQVSAPYGLINSLTGQGGYTGGYSSGGLMDMLGGIFSSGSSGGSTGSILDLFSGRTMTAEKAAEYIMENHFDPNLLVWQGNRITLPQAQWDMVESVMMNVFVDDGSGYIDLGTDASFVIEGDSIVHDFDNTWISIDRHPVAFYYLGSVEEGDQYVISGYVPAYLNGERVNLILQFDSERPAGYIAGAIAVYKGGETETQAKMIIDVGEGDRLRFICEYYDYDQTFRDTYFLGDEIKLGRTVEIANTPISSDPGRCRVTYCFTDYYQQRYWTPAAP